MKVGFTGTQTGMSEVQRKELAIFIFTHKRGLELHHGDCLGADWEAHKLTNGLEQEIRVVVHPPKASIKRAFCIGDEEREPKNYLERNQNIVNEVDLLIAAPRTDEETLRSGTWATIRYARRVGRDIIMLKR